MHSPLPMKRNRVYIDCVLIFLFVFSLSLKTDSFLKQYNLTIVYPPSTPSTSCPLPASSAACLSLEKDRMLRDNNQT